MTSEYLTAKELAALLRIKERKVYQLASSGEIPCSRAMGKLLFPRQAVEDWITRGAKSGRTTQEPERPAVFLGSHDPLLEWALKASRSGLATYFDGSFDGLDRFANREGIATGLHVFDPENQDWNTPLVGERFKQSPVVLVEWAWRSRGLILTRDVEGAVSDLSDLRGRRVAPRQAEAGSQGLFLHLLDRQGLSVGDLDFTQPCRTEADAAMAVLEGQAEVSFGLESLAHRLRLGFVPITKERFDLLVDRRAWFEPPFQRLLEFCRSDEFRQNLENIKGYDTGGLGRVHFNGA